MLRGAASVWVSVARPATPEETELSVAVIVTPWTTLELVIVAV